MDARCPLCTAVFQTDRTGVQFCPNCGQQVNVADTAGSAPGGSGPNFGAPRPGATGPNFGVPPGATPPPPFPGGPREPTAWEQRGQLGFFGAFFGTLRDVMFGPNTFFGRAKTNEPVWDAILFSWICTAIWYLLSLPFTLAHAERPLLRYYQRAIEQIPNFPPELRRLYQKQLADSLNESTAGALGKWLGMMLLVLAGVLMWAVIVHLFALMTGAAKNGIGATIRATCYGFAPMVFAFIPCLNVIAMGYSLVLSIIGLSKLQETTGGRAAGAFLLPFAIFCCCCCGFSVLAGMGMAGAMGSMKQ